jgi:hypothetical protein
MGNNLPKCQAIGNQKKIGVSMFIYGKEEKPKNQSEEIRKFSIY